MSYSAKMIVFSDADTVMAERIRAAIGKAGGRVTEAKCSMTSATTGEHYIVFLIPEIPALPGIVRAVEALSGAAVMAVTDPKPVKVAQKT